MGCLLVTPHLPAGSLHTLFTQSIALLTHCATAYDGYTQGWLGHPWNPIGGPPQGALQAWAKNRKKAEMAHMGGSSQGSAVCCQC